MQLFTCSSLTFWQVCRGDAALAYSSAAFALGTTISVNVGSGAATCVK